MAVGAVVPGDNGATWVFREFKMAIVLSCALSLVGFVRVYGSNSTVEESIAITVALFLIVSISIVLGAALPILLDRIGAGASNAATTIQVAMDVSGVAITCLVCSTLLDGQVLHGLLPAAWAAS